MAKKRGVLFPLATLALSLAACADRAETAWEEAELPMPILVETVRLGGEPEMLSVIEASSDDIGRCCFHGGDGFSIGIDAPEGRDVTAQDIAEIVDPHVSLYAIGLANLKDTSIVEPLFGSGMRRHVMAEPQKGCVVVSGVRDGIRRAGVINAYDRDTRETQTALSRCNISALLLLHGFPEEEALDYRAYAMPDQRYEWLHAPDMAKLKARDLELNGPFAGYNIPPFEPRSEDMTEGG